MSSRTSDIDADDDDDEGDEEEEDDSECTKDKTPNDVTLDSSNFVLVADDDEWLMQYD